jgi:hypothetical protein
MQVRHCVLSSRLVSCAGHAASILQSSHPCLHGGDSSGANFVEISGKADSGVGE